MLDALHHQPGVRVVGVSQDMFRKYAREFIRKLNIDFPSWMDSDGRYMQQYADVLPAMALPMSVLIKNGEILAVHVGPFKKKSKLIEHVKSYI